jgi:hypothetical protein
MSEIRSNSGQIVTLGRLPERSRPASPLAPHGVHPAIFEPDDLNKLPERIDEAEAALVISARELFYTAGEGAEEGESLDDAMCILHALRNSLKHRPTAIQTMNDLDYLKSA